MRPIALSDEIAVGEVPTREEIAILAKAGFRSILNAQPDGEVTRHLSASAAGEAAATAGMAYAHVPIESRRPLDERIAAYAAAMAGLPRPIFTCCYSGARAAAGWALAVAPQVPPAAIVAACNAAGYDIASILPEIERRHAGLPSPFQTPGAAAFDGPAVAPPSEPEPLRLVVLPRAATAGGFAVSG